MTSQTPTPESLLVAMRTEIGELERQQQILRTQLDRVRAAESQLKAQIDASLCGLTRRESADLRRAITIIGETVAAPCVVYADIDLYDMHDLYDHTTEPAAAAAAAATQEDRPKWTIDIKSEFVNDVASGGYIGMTYRITINAFHAGVIQTVRNMLQSTDDNDMADRCSWSASVEYNDKIYVVNPLSVEDYYKNL